MNIKLIAVLTIALVSCNKEEIEPIQEYKCDCYTEYQEQKPVMVNGQVKMEWQYTGATEPTEQDCSNKTDWKYTNSQETTRERIICQ